MQLGIGNRAIKPDYPFGVVVERDAVGLEPNRILNQPSIFLVDHATTSWH
jgi:hypothetical protein